MTLPNLHPVVLCGGSGTLLWPLSGASYSKQLLTLVDERHSLLQITLLRAAALPGAQPPLLVCNTEHWMVVSGTVKVTVCEREVLLSENQSTYIPLGEDDIVRFDDAYARLDGVAALSIVPIDTKRKGVKK